MSDQERHCGCTFKGYEVVSRCVYHTDGLHALTSKVSELEAELAARTHNYDYWREYAESLAQENAELKARAKRDGWGCVCKFGMDDSMVQECAYHAQQRKTGFLNRLKDIFGK